VVFVKAGNQVLLPDSYHLAAHPFAGLGLDKVRIHPEK